MASSAVTNPLKSCLKRQLVQPNTVSIFMGHNLSPHSLADYDRSQDDSLTQAMNLRQTVTNTRCNTPYHHIYSRDRLFHVNGREASPFVPLDDMIDPLLRDLEATNAAAESLRNGGGDQTSEIGSDDEFYTDTNGQERADHGQLTEITRQKNVSWNNDLVEVRQFKTNAIDPDLISSHRAHLQRERIKLQSGFVPT